MNYAHYSTNRWYVIKLLWSIYTIWSFTEHKKRKCLSEDVTVIAIICKLCIIESHHGIKLIMHLSTQKIC